MRDVTTAPRTAAGQRLLELHSHRPVEGDEPGTPDNVWCFADDEEWPCPFALNLGRIEAEAIEPLLALVRAAETTHHRQMRALPGEAPCCMACGEDWPCPEYVALVALPESVRVASRKP